jgi:cytohesin
LTSARLAEAKDTISRFHVSMSAAHTIVAQACLGVLLHLDENITKDGLEKFPLAEYAAEHWVGHARFENVSSKVQDGMKCLFDPSKSHLSVWVWITDPEDPWRRFEQPECPAKARATSLHYAALCGIHDVAAFLIVEHSQDVNARGFGNKETPLHVASWHGHADVAQLLLEHGADVEARDDGDESTPLLLASGGGHVEVARVLLEHGADMEARDDCDWNPLALASFFGHVEIARVLLEHGADVKAKVIYTDTPLHLARGEEVTRLLLKNGADANALNIGDETPLHTASKDGHVGVARALLEHGVDANARDTYNATSPLHLASSNGWPDVARLLLQNGSDIHARDNKGCTPFMRAAARGDDEIKDLLLLYGAGDHMKR